MIMNITFKNTKYNERTSYGMIRVVCVFYFTKRYYDTIMYNENRVFYISLLTNKTYYKNTIDPNLHG